MQHADIVVPVHKATPWISGYVIIESVDKKCGKEIHIFLDPTPLNIHEAYYSQAPDDIYHKLSKAKCFTVIDFKKSGK